MSKKKKKYSPMMELRLESILTDSLATARQKSMASERLMGNMPINPMPGAAPLATPEAANSPQSAMDAFLKARQPNMLSRLGEGMSGFAAPFLGQTWKPSSNENNLLDLIKFQALQSQRGITADQKAINFKRLVMKMSEAQAYKEFGGSMMAGISLRDPKQLLKFNARKEELYKKNLKLFEGGTAGSAEEDVDLDYGEAF